MQILFGKTSEKNGNMERRVNKIIIHPSFNPVYGINDIALLRLSETVTFQGELICYATYQYLKHPMPFI